MHRRSREPKNLFSRIARRLKYEAWLRGYYLPRERLERICTRLDSRSGVMNIKRNPPLVVSLTTVPERISTVHLCINTLLRQSLKPDRIVLWLSENTEEGKPTVLPESLPTSLTRLQARGLEIRWCDDIRSYRKLIPTLKDAPEALIVTADDDFFYPRNWLKELYKSYQADKRYIYCHRAHWMILDDKARLLPYEEWEWFAPGVTGPSTRLFPTSGGGTLFAPGHLDGEVMNQEAFLACCPFADDIWFKAMSLKAGTLSKKIRPYSKESLVIRNTQRVSMYRHNMSGNDQQLLNTFNRYDLWDSLLVSD